MNVRWSTLFFAVGSLASASGCVFIDDFSRFRTNPTDAATEDASSDVDASTTDAGATDVDARAAHEDASSDSGVDVPELTDVIDLAVGRSHACAVRNGGELLCWGSNTSGELGVLLPRGLDRVTRPVVVMARGVRAVEAGSEFTCALVGEHGEVWCWGENTSAQLGDGTTEDRTTPAPVIGLTGATSIAVGDDHACAIVAEGRVLCWGSNYQHQLGTSSGLEHSSPVEVASDLTHVTKLAASNVHGCAIDSAGQLRCWGGNVFGQLGTGSPDGETPTPTAVALSGTVTDVATGMEHTCAIHGGLLSCWGSNSVSQLAQPGARMEPLPVRVELSEAPIRLTGGARFRHTCVVGASSRVWCWGEANLLGAGIMDLPNGRATPIEAEGLDDIVEVSSGPWASCARTSAGRVRCWGYNSWGVLGDGTRMDRFVPSSVLAPE